MRARCRSTATVAAAVFLLLRGANAAAFCRTTTCDAAVEECRRNKNGCIRDGVPLRWKESPIVYRFHRAGSAKLAEKASRAAIRRAFEAWTKVECVGGRTSLRFDEGADVDADKPLDEKTAPESFGIYFRDASWPHADGDESLALTNQIYGKITGNIEYADIEINTANNRFAISDADPGPDLQAVVTHEVGHYIGLAHSTDESSIMVARYCQNADLRCGTSVDQARALADDDRSAVCAAYPPATGTKRPAEEGGCSQPGKSSGAASPAAAFALVVLACGAVRRGRRAPVPGR